MSNLLKIKIKKGNIELCYEQTIENAKTFAASAEKGYFLATNLNCFSALSS